MLFIYLQDRSCNKGELPFRGFNKALGLDFGFAAADRTLNKYIFMILLERKVEKIFLCLEIYLDGASQQLKKV